MSLPQYSTGIKRQFRQASPKTPGKSQAKDLCQTPAYALEPLIPYLKDDWVIWESAAGEGYLSRELEHKGFEVVATDILTGYNFFEYQPDEWDVQITNPPFSLKFDWLERSYELGKPFALLVSVEFMGTGTAQRMFKKHGIEVILLDKRVDFRTTNTSFEKSSAWFPVCWYTWQLDIGSPLNFATIQKRR